MDSLLLLFGNLDSGDLVPQEVIAHSRIRVKKMRLTIRSHTCGSVKIFYRKTVVSRTRQNR